MLRRRHLLAGLTAAPIAARAQGWAPTRPIQCIIGFAPGGGADLIARAIIEAAQPLFPQPLVVVNKPGAGGTIAAQQVAGLQGDGHMLLMGGGSESTSIPAFRALPYDARNGFRAVIRLMRQQMFILGRTDGPYRTMREAMAVARVKPQAVSHGFLRQWLDLPRRLRGAGEARGSRVAARALSPAARRGCRRWPRARST